MKNYVTLILMSVRRIEVYTDLSLKLTTVLSLKTVAVYWYRFHQTLPKYNKKILS